MQNNHFNRNFASRCSNKENGFSLLELLVVLGLIGAIAGIILPSLNLSTTSQSSVAIKEFTQTLRSTYDAAVLTGRTHRVVIQPKGGNYWAEQSPMGYSGRPPLAVDKFKNAAFDASDRQKFLEELEKEVENSRPSEKQKKSSEGEEKKYTIRSVLVQQRKTFTAVKWTEVDDPVLSKKALPKDIVISGILTDTMENRLEYATATEKDFVYIYFFASGQGQQASIQLASLQSENTINETGPKFTLNLDPLTGQTDLLEGFVDTEFKKVVE